MSEEKNRRKQLLREIQQKEQASFDSSLPLPRQHFKQLLDHLDENLVSCDHTLKLTNAFLNGIPNLPAVHVWLADHGAYCDCEVLANIDKYFEND